MHDRWSADGLGRSRPGVPQWGELSEFYRGSVRRQVANVMWMVETIAGHVWALGEPEPDPLAAQLRGISPLQQLHLLGFPQDVCYAMAKAEHEDWTRYYRQDGWAYNEQRNDARKLHPKLVSWKQIAANPELLQAAVASVAATLIGLRSFGFRSRPFWDRYGRIGPVTAKRHRLRWNWTSPSGTRRRASSGEWEVCAGGQCWPVADADLRRCYRRIDGDQWERTAVVLAAPAGDGEIINTVDGPVTAAAGDWVVQGERGEHWRVSGEEFARCYRGPVSLTDDRS
jgi:hypothetical protein